ncbi:aldehyde dehydrogenase family protein [Mesorhizobium sp. YC-39]|uniref:aldehyde dehydrogenase family protein n=1 Tax=unclassified Mesorhizobium TaxID=325217 RepID=UPI0021E94640|nr:MULTISPECIES: aldehyde dehydrogenase family protein [unclassified Mesorhizobium]MCV3205252.1 aldehyde dehydrogenase family protein [Mesorhizobium sp. YC-2]MCV3228349.1 aldehyde dehydrogenase family protein [Mesorhizobium sp. YC-39]
MHRIPTFGASDLKQVRETARRLDSAWIGGGFSRDSGSDVRDIMSPFDGETISEVAFASERQVDLAVQAARAALKADWGTMGHEGRAALIRALADAVEKNRLELALLESLDVGKPILHSYNDDVPTTVGVLRWYASLTETAYDLSPARRKGVLSQIVREPQGVVGIVLPWNYPLTTLALKIGPALAAGNTVVCKPADDTPLTTLRLAELAIEAGFPAGVINVIPGTGAVAGKALGLHDHVSAINFTGSTATGRRFLHYSADSNLKEISLECGGKNPAIILPDVKSLDRFADDISTGFLMNSGQLCSSISRVLAPRALEGGLRDMLAAKMKQWPIGDPFDPATRIGPLVSDAHAAKVNRAIDTEKHRNNDFSASAAETTGASPRLVEPVVFFNVAESADAWTEEVFGPVLSVRFYDDLSSAIRSANDTQYGLSAYIFGGDPDAIREASTALDAGFVAINAFCEGDFSTPFGGFKTSGFGGKDKGIHSLDQYSRTKSIWWAT